MPTRQLMLKKIRCVEDTEGGGESPYLLVFMGTRITSGSATPPGQLMRSRISAWDNQFNPGVSKSIQEILFESEAGGNFVFAILLEEDFDPDLAATSLMTMMFRSVWTIYGGPAWGNLTATQLQQIVREKLRDLVKPMLSNDEYLGVRSMVVPTINEDTDFPEMKFTGDGGDFRVTLGLRIKGG